MSSKRQFFKFLFLLFLLIIVAACGGGEPEVVEVTRVVTETETVEVAGEETIVEVTRVVTETETVTETVTESVVEEQVEVEEAAEEEMEEEAMEEDAADEEMAAQPPDDVSAIGSEDATGDVPPPPDDGPKVESTRTAAEVADSSSGEDIDVRAVSDDVVEVETVELDENSQLTAGEVDDNLAFEAYAAYLAQYQGTAVIEIPVQERYRIQVTDSNGEPLLGAFLQISANGAEVTRLRTHADGTALFFPQMFGETAVSYTISSSINDQTITTELIPNGSTLVHTIEHPVVDEKPARPTVDILFLIDATGSMADEIQQLKNNIEAMATQIAALPSAPNARFGMVTYRDQGDDYLTQQTPFTFSVEEFSAALDQVEAAGGGDYPEDLHTALDEAVGSMTWQVENTVSLVFLVADAPPHLDYQQENDYAVSLRRANELGIKIYPIASSGLDAQGEYIFRQLAQVTNGRFIFLTYGSEGPGTSGTETDLNVSDYTVSALDQIVVNIVAEELSYR